MVVQRNHAPLWTAVADAVTNDIVSGALQPGAPIETESQLCERFDVSRTVVREAIKVLSGRGFITIHRGTGTTVNASDQWQSLDANVLAARLKHGDRERVLGELMVLRRGVEPEIAAAAAERCSESDLAMLGTRVAALEAGLDDPDEYRLADSQFHAALAAIANIALAQELFRQLDEPLRVARGLTNLIPDAIANAHAHHMEIFRHVRDRNPDAAREAMRTHLDWASERLSLVL